MNLTFITMALVAGAALSTPALAYRGYDSRYEVRYDWATVVDVDPIIERSSRPAVRSGSASPQASNSNPARPGSSASGPISTRAR